MSRARAEVAEASPPRPGSRPGSSAARRAGSTSSELAEHELKAARQADRSGADLRSEIAQRVARAARRADRAARGDLRASTATGSPTSASTPGSPTTLQRLHREAYNSALAMARLAEQAYRFERGDDATALLRRRLLGRRPGRAARRRAAASSTSQNMERRFIETNYRTLEIDQAFSLTQVDPGGAGAAARDRRVRLRDPRGVLRPLLPGPLPPAHQGGAADHPVRHRAVHQRQRDADPARTADPPRARRLGAAGAGRRAAAAQRLDRHQHRRRTTPASSSSASATSATCRSRAPARSATGG